MLEQAYKINSWGKNVYVKIPVVNSKGFFMGSVIKIVKQSRSQTKYHCCLYLISKLKKYIKH